MADQFIVLRPRGDVSLIPCDGEPPLQLLRDTVDGYIEMVYTQITGERPNRRFVLVINEEGLLHQLPPTAVWPDVGVLVGPIMIGVQCGDEFLPLTEQEQRRVVVKHDFANADGWNLPLLLIE